MYSMYVCIYICALCMYVCMYIYIYIYIHTHTHTDTQAYIQTLFTAPTHTPIIPSKTCLFPLYAHVHTYINRHTLFCCPSRIPSSRLHAVYMHTNRHTEDIHRNYFLFKLSHLLSSIHQCIYTGTCLIFLFQLAPSLVSIPRCSLPYTSRRSPSRTPPVAIRIYTGIVLCMYTSFFHICMLARASPCC
jgi:hypothetical protein